MSGYFVNGKTDEKSVKDFKDLESCDQELINAAIAARKNSYSPYSKFPVGAALRTENGQIYSGCNIENAAFTAGICAERTAAAKAISEGHKVFTGLAVVALQENSFTSPCGVCRQFLSEFADKDFPVFITKPINPPLRVLCSSILQLLPYNFRM